MATRDYTTPIVVALVCDDCGHRDALDVLVPAGQDSLAVARAHAVRHEGWRVIPGGDFCPACVHISGIAQLEQEDAERDEYWRWRNFGVVRQTLWCRCRQDSWPHVWGAPESFDPSDHERVPPSLHWELGRFQDDARFAHIIPKPAAGGPNTPGMWCHP